MDFSTFTLWTGPFPIYGVLISFFCFFFLLLDFVEITELNANSVDPDQMPCPEASDLGLHCLPVSLL